MPLPLGTSTTNTGLKLIKFDNLSLTVFILNFVIFK